MAYHNNSAYQDLAVYYGDLHNHCGLSYGHGTFAEAIKNARLQLDFASVTLHAVWPDIPENDERLGYLVDYHKEGFKKAFHNWQTYLAETEAANDPGHFITFPSYEWHSNQFGDHCIYYKNGVGNPILETQDLTELRQALKALPTETFMIPHHIGYKTGFRGINWKAFTNELSPVVEVFSFHGCSESSEGPYPYLHTMGPRDSQSCAQSGWAMGNLFGVVGSTDHHNAFPGSYGSGRLGVWASSLSREAIWDAIAKRRTYALTGDRIQLQFSLNGRPMGSICPPDETRHITVAVDGGDTLDYIEILHNNQVIHRECLIPPKAAGKRFKVYVEFGWGEFDEDTFWDVGLQIRRGTLHSIEPRFRGFGAQGDPGSDNYAYTDWSQTDQNNVHFTTRTRRNPSLHSPGTEGMCLEIDGNEKTLIHGEVNGQVYEHSLAELSAGAQTHYLDGFVSPAIDFHRAVPQSEYQHEFNFTHINHHPEQRDWYALRVRQRNNQWAWSSPIWVEK